MINKIKKSDVLKSAYLAAQRTFYREIVKNTPGKGIVRDGWDLEIEGDDIVIVNKEFGDIIKFLEFGTNGPYKIRPKNAKALKWNVGPGDKFAFAKEVTHPGIEARRFIYNALNNQSLQKEFEEEFEKNLLKYI